MKKVRNNPRDKAWDVIRNAPTGKTIEDYTKTIELFLSAKPYFCLEERPWFKSRVYAALRCFVSRAEAYFENGDYDCVIADCSNSLTIRQELFSHDSLGYDRESYRLRALAYYKTGNYEGAASDCKRILDILGQKEWKCLWKYTKAQYSSKITPKLDFELQKIRKWRAEMTDLILKLEKLAYFLHKQ